MNSRWSSSAIREMFAHARQPGVISLAGGLPDPESFPIARFMEAQAEVMKNPAVALQYGSTEGEPLLREMLGGLDKVVLTAGGQQALNLLVWTLGEGEIWVENPCYLGFRQILQAHESQVKGFNLEPDGINVDAVETALRYSKPSLMYVNPFFQNPTGVVLSEEKIHKLISLAERHNFWLIFDNPYEDIWFFEKPPQIPHSEKVIQVKSFSKVLSPALRVGYVQAAKPVLELVGLSKQSADLQSSTLNQLIVAEMINNDQWFENHKKHLRSIYAEKSKNLCLALNQAIPGIIEDTPKGGFFAWGKFPEGVDSQIVLQSAVKNGVTFVPGTAFDVNSNSRSRVRLCWTTFPEGEASVAASRLALSLE